MEEESGFHLIAAHNAFNEINRMVILWVIRYQERASASIPTNRMHSWSIMEQYHNKPRRSDPLSMSCCGIGILPFVRKLKIELPAAKHGRVGIRAQFERLFSIIACHSLASYRSGDNRQSALPRINVFSLPNEWETDVPILSANSS